jgi:hypothetical protein
MDGEASYNLLQWPLSECLSMFILQRLLNDWEFCLMQEIY